MATRYSGKDGLRLVLHKVSVRYTTGVFRGYPPEYLANPNEGWIVGGDYDTITGQGRDGLILHTTNGGANWTAQISNAPYDFWGVHFIDNQNGWVCGYKDTASPGVFFKTTDGGNSWTEIIAPSVSIGKYSLYGVKFVDNLNGFAVGGGNRAGWQGSYFGIFLKTTNSGTNWEVDTVIFDNDPGGVAPLGMDMFNLRWGYAGGARLSVFRYTPLGAQEIAEKGDVLLQVENIPTIILPGNQINLNINGQNQYSKLEIYDALGRRVLIKDLTQVRVVSLKNLARGCYFLRLHKDKGSYLSKKIIIL